ncbi:uncharacterized protein [Euwallacea fornicatus]|uniref:uncharacterized protein n=1 Tax=Euwallacea fornicatus TaxID=995702 RepID=UPI00338F38F3
MLINQVMAVVVITTITNCCVNAKSLLNAESNSSTPYPEKLAKKQNKAQRSWTEFEEAVPDKSVTSLIGDSVPNSEKIAITGGPVKIPIFSSDNVQKDETTNLCPKELAKLQKRIENERYKRQSSYYPSQDHNQSPGAIRPKSMNQPRSPQTYHQMQRHYPAKTQYQNYKQPVKGYQNPSVYVRYPSNGNFKGNYYKVQRRSGGNAGVRTQYQGRPASTTVKSIRATIKKKFRPSPIFV